MSSLNDRLNLWREYNRISEAGEIARRAFVNNSFDGVLTMMGVIMGNFVVGVEDATVVLITGLSTALAIGISGGWGAYLTESAERRQDIDELEQVTLTDLADTKIGKASRAAVVTVAAVDGLSPFMAAFVVVLPFFLIPILPSVLYAYYAAIALALLALFGLGIYLGRLSKRSLIMSGLRTAFAGVVCMGLSYLLERLAH
jgi:predicted membrane protein (TIGR00267 family)